MKIGLEVFDQLTKQWTYPEMAFGLRNEESGKVIGEQRFAYVVILLGECLELITNHYIKATVHRVRIPTHANASRSRISAPFLVRGKLNSVIPRINTPPAAHTTTSAAAHFKLPDLDGIDMRTVHFILDNKRRKCQERHERERRKMRVLRRKRECYEEDVCSDDYTSNIETVSNDWVLSSWPVS